MHRCERLFPPDHEIALDAKFMMVFACLGIGRSEEAEALSIEMMPKMSNLYGESHDKVLDMKLTYSLSL